MSIPTIPTGKNQYYDLGPVRQFDVQVIRNALMCYADSLSTELNAGITDNDKRCMMAEMKIKARELSDRYAKTLPIYE